MAMIIDGYNVLHASRWLRSSRKGLDRAAFCRLLATLAGRRSEKITVVFDALPARGDTAITRTLPVKVVYSGHDRTADDVIIQMIKASTGPRDLTVVSSDRRIRSAAKRRGCKTKPAGEFIRAFDAELNQAKKHASQEPPEKHQGLDQDQRRQWMDEFGFDDDDEDDPYEGMYR